MAIYRTEGPFLHNISVSVSSEGGQSEKSFVLEVAGNLAGRPGQPTAVRIFAAKQVYPTNTDITFWALADVPDPVEILWYFGDSRSGRTSSRTITTRYHNPGRYEVVAVVSLGQMSLTSDVMTLLIQRAVKLNRLVHQASVLQNQMVRVSCRVNAGTNVTFLWSFGDGTVRPGQSTEQHIFNRTGEFGIDVVVSNLVSSATMSSYIFVVDQPCQPPPVKNMGPLKVQVPRYEIIRLGVTYETEVDCDVSGGLHYTWTLFNSAGQSVSLPHTDTDRQSLILQSHLLQYDTYSATARVQVINSVVYNNYSVKVQVMPSPPVAFIQGGTNVFITNTSTAMVTLNGEASYDPDFPMNRLSYSWTCKPVSSITSSCFNQHIPTSSPLLTFPVSFLKHNFDQFQFTLTVQSEERSASSDTFLTVTSNLLRKVLVNCPECQGDHVNWDQSFSVSAVCEDCGAEHIEYTWSLHLVNASSKPVADADLSAPSAIMEIPATSPHTPEMPTQHPLIINASQDTLTVYASAHPLLMEYGSETKADEQNHDQNDIRTPSNTDRNTINKGLSESSSSSLDNVSDHTDSLGELPLDPDSSADWEFYFPLLENGDAGGRTDYVDYHDPYPNAEEGDPGMSAGRPAGVDSEGFTAEDNSDPELHEDEGSNLVELKPSQVTREPTLIDLPRDPVDRSLFESYTYTGISSPLLSFRPFSLRPNSRYMLEVIAKSQKGFLGQTQLFLKTNPVPKGMTCQVQPAKGMELHTHFSIFCTSGKEDLMYEYSFSVGGRPRRILYQGRDFQYYFSLPSGDPVDDHKVTVYTEVRSSTYGSATKPCPVIIQVQPSFLRDNSSSSAHHDPDLELSESGLKNLSALLQLGNGAETRNYISLLSSTLNRLSLDTEANTHVQRRFRNVLIGTVCELESSDQVSMADNICILKDLLEVTNQVTAVSVRRVTAYVQQFCEASAGSWCLSDQDTLNSLVSLLSYSLRVVSTGDFTAETTKSADITQVSDSGSSTGLHIKQSVPVKQAVQLVADILQTASDLILKHMIFHEKQEHRVSTSLISLYATYQNQTSTVIRSASATFYMPAPLVQMLLFHHHREQRQHQPCVLRVVTELAYSPYTCANYHTQMSGPVVDLKLYKCSTRRKIPIRSLVQPISIELQHPQRNRTSLHEYILSQHQINYHSFNITQEHLQQAIQLTIVFTPPSNKVFPIMLLFRMFERPTPSMHHLHRIHHWGSNTTRITLLPSYLNAAGVGYLALLNADFNKASRNKHWSDKVSYSLTVDSSQCLSWDGQQGAWTHHGCITQQTDTTPAVNCSCHQLRPLTVVQQQIQSSHDTADLDLFLSVSRNLTVLGVLLVCMCLYIPVLVVCKRADVLSQESHRAHYLSDNSPSDPYLYAVTIHTGLCSAARITAKVYIVLYGEDGFSQTKELYAPGFTLFRRNSQDTFILSSAESLGPVWGVHIWHDNSGPTSDWYIKLVEVSEVKRGHVKGCAWLFAGQCWLAVNRGDGRVERMLCVCAGGIGFAKMLCLKLSDYLADYHLWMSVHSRPTPNSFTHAQRLSVCLLLLLGYACVNTVIISHITSADQLQVELGIIDVSAASVKNGFLSVVAVLPVATVISLLFRLCGVQHAKCRMTENDYAEDALSLTSVLELPVSWSGFQQWAQDVWRKKQEDSDLLSVFTTILGTDKEAVIQPAVSKVTQKEDALALKNSLGAALQESHADYLSESSSHQESSSEFSMRAEDPAVQQRREKNHQGKSSLDCGLKKDCHQNTQSAYRLPSQRCHCLVWALCLMLSLFCLVLSVVLGMRFSSSKVLLWIHSLFVSLMLCIFLIQPALQLGARQRARYLRLVRPPTPAELRNSRRKKRREALIHKTLRDLSLCASMLFLMMCITFGSSSSDHYNLSKAVRQQFVRNHNNAFMSIQTHEGWWKWTQTSLLDLLYMNSSTKTKVFMEMPQKSCGRLGCYSDWGATVVVGHTKSEAALKLKHLHSGGWVGRRTVALKVQFTLYSPAPNLFTTVILLTEQSPAGILLPSATVQSVRVYHTPVVWDYVAMVSQLLFLLLSLPQLSHQVSNVRQQGLMGYWRTPCNWVEISLLAVTLVYYISYIYRSIVMMEVVELLQRHHSRGHVDVSLLATWEQFIRTLRGFILFLLTMKCVAVLRVNRILASLLSHSLSSLLWPMISGLILLVALSCVGKLLHIQSFSSGPRSLQAIHFHYRGVRTADLSHHRRGFCGFLHLSSTVVWTAMVFGVVSSIVKSYKRCGRRRNVFTFTELAGYIRQRVSDFTGQQRQTWNHTEGRTYYLEEFDGLLDELLFRLNTLSNSLHHTLPSKAQQYREEDSPAVTPVPEPVNMDTQDSESTVNEPMDGNIYSSSNHGEIIPHLCR
ncbi:polycystic kidney disease 1 like 1 [Parambassis ranga]|uniref:Polycystic kidney disease 1 like 1 n=1 Tax=Parambassis ranga TaxID=210632 RepID=A0A6P7KI88_9TELE|nr:polycystic kidney disease protein 1-like 1 [Parambassis ranga]